MRLYSVQRSKRYIFLTLEYCAGGDLSNLLRRAGPLDEDTCRRLMRDVVAALHYLHDRSLVHRDIKPQNLLLSGPLSDPASAVKVADFGFARSLPPAALASTLCGSPHYMSPELLAFKPYDSKADLWSVGVVLAELLTGRPPFTGANPLDLLRGITQNAWLQSSGDGSGGGEVDTCGGVLPPAVAARTSAACKAVLRGLLRADPALRWSHEQLFAAAWFSGGPEVHRGAGVVAGGMPLHLSRVAEWPPDRAEVDVGSAGSVGAVADVRGGDSPSVPSHVLPATAGAISSQEAPVPVPGDSGDTLHWESGSGAAPFGVTVLDEEGGEVSARETRPPLPPPSTGSELLPSTAEIDPTSYAGDTAGITPEPEAPQRGAPWVGAARFPLALLADTAARGYRAGTLLAESAATIQSYVRRYVTPEAARDSPTAASRAAAAASIHVSDASNVKLSGSVEPDFLAEVLEAVWPRSVLKLSASTALVSACHVDPLGLPTTLQDLDAMLETAETALAAPGTSLLRVGCSQRTLADDNNDSPADLTWAVWAARLVNVADANIRAGNSPAEPVSLMQCSRPAAFPGGDGECAPGETPSSHLVGEVLSPPGTVGASVHCDAADSGPRVSSGIRAADVGSMSGSDTDPAWVMV